MIGRARNRARLQRETQQALPHDQHVVRGEPRLRTGSSCTRGRSPATAGKVGTPERRPTQATGKSEDRPDQLSVPSIHRLDERQVGPG